MKITVGTYNLNNLFSRFNFSAQISTKKNKPPDVETPVYYMIESNDLVKYREYSGKLIQPKKEEEIATIAAKVNSMDLDILAVQEVEDIDTLREFNRTYLKNDNGSARYPYEVLIEGNDKRFIDIGILSKFPVTSITSWQNARFNIDDYHPVFSRDLLQVDIFNNTGTKRLFTIFNTHLKSNYVPWYTEDKQAAADKNNDIRSRQAEVIKRIIKDQTRPDSSYILVGDMNDRPDSEFLEGFTLNQELGLSDAVVNAVELGQMNHTPYPPPDGAVWSHRYKKASGDYRYHLYDHIWVSPALADKVTGSYILRREKVGGDGSDHDPVWIELDV